MRSAGSAERLGWDTIDETYARMRGYETRSYADLVAPPPPPVGSADGLLRGRARHGECAWILHYSLPWVLLRSLKVARTRPRGVSGAGVPVRLPAGRGAGVAQVDDPAFRSFVRRELRGQDSALGEHREAQRMSDPGAGC